MDPSPNRIVVEFDPGADLIAGQILAYGQQPRAYAGWTGLFAALRAATGEDSRVERATGVDEVGERS